MADDGLVSGAELGTLIDLHERQVRKLAERGVIARYPGGRYDAPAAIVAYVRHLREMAGGRASADGADLVAERAKLARQQTIKTRMANEVTRGELIPVAAVTSAIVELIELSKARLRRVPAKVAKTDGKLKAAIEDAIVEALEDLTPTRVQEKLGRPEGAEEDADPEG